MFSGGGGIYSTAPDYLTLLQALLNGGSFRGTTILQPETVASMSANQIGNLEAGILKTCLLYTSDAAAGAVEWWKFSRDKHPPAGDRCLDVHKPDRQR